MCGSFGLCLCLCKGTQVVRRRGVYLKLNERDSPELGRGRGLPGGTQDSIIDINIQPTSEFAAA